MWLAEFGSGVSNPRLKSGGSYYSSTSDIVGLSYASARVVLPIDIIVILRRRAQASTMPQLALKAQDSVSVMVFRSHDSISVFRISVSSMEGAENSHLKPCRLLDAGSLAGQPLRSPGSISSAET